MNWISVIAVAIVVFTLVLWVVSKRNVFTGPAVDMEKMRLRREEALGIAGGDHIVEGDTMLRKEKI